MRRSPPVRDARRWRPEGSWWPEQIAFAWTMVAFLVYPAFSPRRGKATPPAAAPDRAAAGVRIPGMRAPAGVRWLVSGHLPARADVLPPLRCRPQHFAAMTQPRAPQGA